MTIEQQHDQEQAHVDEAWLVYQYQTGRRDADHFRRAYLGHYPSREAFGVDLAERLGIGARLARLPIWTRAYLRVDGEAVLRDFEAAGHFWVHELPDGRGAYVFDAEEQPAD